MGASSSSAIVLICSYRPRPALVAHVRTLIEQCDTPVLLVDDGSGVEYRQIFADALAAGPNRVTLLSHEHNKGKGAALKTGFAHVLEGAKHGTAPGHVVCVDADGQHQPTDVKKVLEKCAGSAGTVVLGCRSFDGKVPFRSLFGNLLTREIFGLVSGQRISDTQTGLRAIPFELLGDMIALPENRYEFETRQLLRIVELGVPLAIVPIETIYFANTDSHFNPVRDSVLIYRVLLEKLISRRRRR